MTYCIRRSRQTVRSGGFLWLNPIAMSVVNCSRAELRMVESEFSLLSLLDREVRLADMKFLGLCPCQVSV